MQMLKCRSDLCDHEARWTFPEPAVRHHMTEQVATLDKIEDKEDVHIILENVLHRYDERVTDLE